MSFETDIFDKYGSVFSGRLWWDQTPDGMQPAAMMEPFCIVQQVGGKYLRYVDDTEHEFLNAHLQMFVWGAHRIEVADKMRQLAATVMASNLPEWYATAMSAPVGDHNEVLKIRGSRQDFDFWFRNPLYVS